MQVYSISRTVCEDFDRKRIIKSLMRETNISREDAVKIARSVRRQLNDRGIEYVSTLEIRDLVRSQLFKRGFISEAKNYETIGMPIYEIRKNLYSVNKDNANLQDNPETFHKIIADRVCKEFALTLFPKEISKAHLTGDIHIHDLEYFASRSLNCLQHDLRYYIRNGLAVDGSGEHTSLAGPAKNIETLVNHAGQALMSAQNNMSGGQAYSLFNIFAAPFATGLPYERIKQAMQMFIFNLNMSYTSRGGQVPFTSINLDFEIPDFLEDEPAYGPGGKIVGTYGDYEEEARLILKAITEVHYEGDYGGKPHLFPNTIYNLRKKTFKEDEELLYDVIRLSKKYSIPYFLNQEIKGAGVFSNTMGCRTRLNTNWTGDWEKDCLRTGNLTFVSINFPRVAYKGGDNYQGALEKTLECAIRAILLRRKQAIRLMEAGKLKFLTQKDDSGPLYRIEHATHTIGLVGMHEFCKALGIEDGIIDKDGQKEVKAVIDFLKEQLSVVAEETGLRWTLFQTPAETTAHRFAKLDIKYYPEKVIYNGEKESAYYTNSTHVPVNSEISLLDKILIEEQYHEDLLGGHIMHIWMGESGGSDEAYYRLTKNIYKRKKIGFWAYSTAFTYCFNCQKMANGLIPKCLYCSEEDNIEWYDRITGYLQQVGRKKGSIGGWNPGKVSELYDRRRLIMGE